MMAASIRLSQTDSVNEELYEQEVGSMFEKEAEKFRVEVRCRSTREFSAFRKNTQGVGSTSSE